jgi:aerobic-type carbon monoxide dehydrogenase small subunit (CoxS/CutS family)
MAQASRISFRPSSSKRLLRIVSAAFGLRERVSTVWLTVNLHVTVDVQPKEFISQPTDTLLDVLRREGYLDVKVGCANGDCSTCAVLLNGLTVNSCVVLTKHCEGKKIVTIEGVANKDGTLHPLQSEHRGRSCAAC